MTTRRQVLAGAIASACGGAPGWADVGSPDYIAAAMHRDGSHKLHGLRSDGTDAFVLPLPARGHAAAVHPRRAEAVAFARRPGTYALVIDICRGSAVRRLEAPSGNHFYGHGAYSADGKLLITTENQISTGLGQLGLWSADENYRRIAEIPSGGIGPHDIARLPSGGFAIANGGIRTDPRTGRQKLNLETMRPNLTIADAEGRVLDQVELPPDLHKNSIRHLAVGPTGSIAFAMQWQGDVFDVPPLVGLVRTGAAARFFSTDEVLLRRTEGYAASVAISHDETLVAITAPRGGQILLFAAKTGLLDRSISAEDVGGVSAAPGGFVATTGLGRLLRLSRIEDRIIGARRIHWDNHLVSVAQ